MNPEHVEGIRAALTKFLALDPDIPPELREAVANYLVTGIAVSPWDLHELKDTTPIQESAFWLIYYMYTNDAQHVYAPEYKWLMRELSTNYEP